MWKYTHIFHMTYIWNRLRMLLGYTGCILTIYIRNWRFTGLFWDFWGSLRLLCDPKIGRKLLLGQKYSLVSFETSKEAVCQKEEFHDLVFWGCNSGWLRIHFFFMYWILNTIDFKTWLFLKSSTVSTLKTWKKIIRCRDWMFEGINQFWNILNSMPKTPDHEILPFDKQLSYMFKFHLECICALKVICSQSWGHIDALKNLRSPKTSL